MLRLASEPEAVPLTAISSELGSAPEKEAELPLRLLPQASGRLADAPPATAALKACPSSPSRAHICASDGRKSQMAANRPLCMTSPPRCSHASVLCIRSTADWSNTGTVLGGQARVPPALSVLQCCARRSSDVIPRRFPERNHGNLSSQRRGLCLSLIHISEPTRPY